MFLLENNTCPLRLNFFRLLKLIQIQVFCQSICCSVKDYTIILFPWELIRKLNRKTEDIVMYITP